jgi:putative redox protein
MDTANITYLGELRCRSVHVRSGQEMISDAPVDNQGKGSAFSPTDLLCVSYATCILTTMGIAARDKSIPFEEVSARVVKHMASDPRRVARIEVHISMKGAGQSEKDRTVLERIAATCPVAISLNAEVVQDVSFTYL